MNRRVLAVLSAAQSGAFQSQQKATVEAMKQDIPRDVDGGWRKLPLRGLAQRMAGGTVNPNPHLLIVLILTVPYKLSWTSMGTG